MQNRRGRGFQFKFSGWWLFGYIVIEWLLFGFFGSLLGWQTFMILFLLKTFLGMYLLRKSTGFDRNQMFEAAEGFFGAGQLIQSSILIVSGLLLIVPGILTDSIGVLLAMVAGFRRLFRKRPPRSFKQRPESSTTSSEDPRPNRNEGRIIDVEFTDSSHPD